MKSAVSLADLLDWSFFAVEAATYGVLAPDFHRVVPDQFGNTLLICEQLARRRQVEPPMERGDDRATGRPSQSERIPLEVAVDQVELPLVIEDLERRRQHVAADIAAVAGRSATPGDLLEVGVPIEGHADNLAAALYGGVCFAMKRNGSIHAARIAPDMPVGAILAVPATRTNTSQSRGGLPATVTHADAAHNAASAAMLGAAIAGGDASLLRDAFDDRLHEQYRIADAPLLQQLRGHAPDGTVGVTLSGSGPSVVVWADPARADDVARELEASLPYDTMVLPLRVAQEGAHLT